MSARHPWWLGPAAFLGSWVVRLLGFTWRIEQVGIAEGDAWLARGGGCVFAFWHARLLPLCFTHRGRRIAVLISRHRDGELIARIIDHLGFVVARGSSTRGGEEGAREMLSLAQSGHLLAITPDGPRGPAGQVKPGLAFLSSRAGVPVIPVAAAASKSWRLRSWDRFVVPHPFARVVVGYGAPVMVPAGVDAAGLETWRERLQGAIEDLTRDLERRAGDRP